MIFNKKKRSDISFGKIFTTCFFFLKLFYLPQDINIEDGKIVITSGEGGYMPYGVYVGKTKKIGDEIFVETCLNCNNAIRLVGILKLEENFASAKKK